MDSLELDFMEPLSYDMEGDDAVKSGRNRSGTAADEGNSRSKRQRVEETNKAKITKANVVITEVDLDFFGQGQETSPCEANATPTNASDNKRNTEIKTGNHASTVRETNTARGAGSATSHQNGNSDNMNNVIVKYRRVLKRIPNDIPYLPVTCEDGSRLYLRIKPLNDDGELNEPAPCIETKDVNLFKNWNAVKDEARILKDKFHKELAKTVNRDVVTANKDNSDDVTEVCEALWVEKYKPSSFLDLLSQEAVNRALLHWVKLWDKSVFGIDYLAKVKATREKYAKLEAEEKEKDERFHKKSYFPSNEEYDEGGRPALKVALLAGDPGLGKTTCAHIIARHAGYKVREVNASDDRSMEIFRKVLDDTTQSRSEAFQEGKPNCLVIDEIDGAPTPSVNVLVELITGNATESGKKKLKKVLRRPVICICNDLYAPSLKLLKKHAFVIQFPTITIPRLLERLREVSDREKLFLDSNTLQSLCQKSDCDIRSCLSTLQFLKRKRCTPKDALFAQIGMNDKSKGIFAVWSDIFALPEEKKYHDVCDKTKPDVRFRNIVQLVQNFGEYEKLFGGVFENYLHAKYRDSYLQTIIEGLEWSTWFESVRMHVERTQTYGMYGYFPMFFAMAHFLFARRDVMKIHFPNAELSARFPKFQNTVKAQITDTTVGVARFLNTHMLITEIYPAVLSIIQPGNIRPVPTQIWTERERNTLKNVVEVMLTYSLSYTQAKNPETGAYSFVLDPDLEEMVKFKLDSGNLSTKPFPYAVKQLVAREIETEKLRRNDFTPDVVQKESFKLPETPKSSTTPKTKAFEAYNKTPVSVARDFFGRAILVPEVSPEAETKRSKEETAVYFRFTEGYSNAVRRVIRMRDLS